ncbi:SDR family NAD(P)-dependent oxidoreductase [Mycolicibacterium flavescens]|uniref:type I polyketide synthase n=1 Tax=Mycolicibacterium flavescens TaxID=1776 RepID=UPI000AAE9C77|nr:type I polyketide synthase [Mycolicibacterium flavescens]MCV7281299.1 SDR family NAD(P)-dependent oxidoreductase [Mycolicibacterium flavescens]
MTEAHPTDTHPEPVAIIGIGCRVAGDIGTPAQFWKFLLGGGSDVREVPEERWEPYLRRDPRNAAILKDVTRWGTFLDDLPGFDAEFFGVSPREAELMDPQQRLALEVSWEALEHAGVPPKSLAGSDTAVLMGVNSNDYGKLIMEDLPGIEAWTGIGTSLCGIANRVSHLLDLRGPSVALDAACAASLVAVHQACQMLRTGETSLAIAGGVSALIGPGLTRVLDVAGATAPDGRCKTFDAAADGYGRGEGAGVVVLKRLSDALRDGDHVYAVVRGGAVAQDGRTVGIMSPNGEAQADMFRRACEFAGVAPESVSFVEAHGTGTPSGDPTEVGALAAVYGQGRPADAPCRIGSVKPNVGHLEGGAGVIGLIKAALALHHRTIPPTAGVTTLTPAVDWAASGLRVPTRTEPWDHAAGAPRRAAVCSYGYGGTIAHVLLEEAPDTQAAETARPQSFPMILPISARSTTRVQAQARALANRLRDDDTQALEPVAATLWSRRSHEPVRAAVVADTAAAAAEAFTAVAGGDPGAVTGSVLRSAADGAVWVFSGHGSHWTGMGRELLTAAPEFAAVIDTIDPVFGAELGFSARAALSTGELGGTDQVQALTFAMQVGLAAVLRGRGVRPAAIIGHSVGEVAACVTAGVFDLTVGAAVACYRARGFRSVLGKGAMALARLPFDEAERRLAGRTDVVAAISASPQSTVISGVVAGVEDLCRQWGDEGVMMRRVNTDVAFHSPAMDDLTAELGRLTGQLPPPRPPQIPLYTTALPDPRSAARRDQHYWVANLRDRVRFAEAVSAAIDDGHRLFLEVSAHPVVAHSIVETLTESGVDDHAVVPLLRRDRPETRSVATAVAQLHCHGAPVDVGLPAAAPWDADVPVTQWQHRRFWRTPTPPPGGRAVHDVDSHTLLGGRTEVTGAVASRMWQTRVDLDTRPYPGDHPVKGTEIVPAAVIVNTFLAAARAMDSRRGRAGDLVDVRLRTPVAPGRARDVQVVLQDRGLTLATRLVDDEDDEDGGWLTHSSAVVAADEDIEDLVGDVLDEGAARDRCPEALPSGHVVDTLATLGVAAMGFDWEILELHGGDGELIAKVAARGDRTTPATWASLLDAATSAASTVFGGPPRLRMPARIERVQVHGQAPDVALLHVRRRPGGTTTDVVLAEESGKVLAALTGMTFDELENPSGSDVSRMLHQLSWHPVPWQDDARPAAVTVVGGDDATREQVVRDLSAAEVPYDLHADATEFAGAAAALNRDTAVLLIPRRGEDPQASVGAVMQTLRALLDHGAKARLWVLTDQVYEGVNVAHAPLWGLARVAAAEHPDVFGGVLDVAAGPLPIGVLASVHGHPVVVVRDGRARSARLAPAPRGTGSPLQCSAGGTYLITGGTGALGLRMAQRLADIGARRLVLLSRSGMPNRTDWDAESELVRTVSALEERGVSVRVLAVDIAAAGAADVLRDALRELPPVRGVIHAAGVEAGALLVNTTADDFTAAMRPKVDGTLTLHEVFPPEQLDWMVLFSSCGYLAGFPGQGAYACANSFLDVMARHRRRLGDRTVSVAWTAWRGLGMGSTSGFVAAQLDALGMDTIGADEAMRALDLAMRYDEANVVVLPVLPAAASVPMLADVAPAAHDEAAVDDVAVPDLAGADPQRIAEVVAAAVAAQLGVAVDDVDTGLPLVELGVDSIMTVGLLRSLEKQTGLSLPPTLLWEYPTAAAVCEHIGELLCAPAAEQVS